MQLARDMAAAYAAARQLENWSWDEMESGQKVAWLMAATTALETFAPTAVFTDAPPATLLHHNVRIDKTIRRSLMLLRETLDIQKECRLGTPERTLSFRALQSAGHWLGENLGLYREMGEKLGIKLEDPYPGSKDPTSPAVQPVGSLNPEQEQQEQEQQGAWNWGMPVHVLDAISGEREYQESKWPGHEHTVAEWILILRKVLNDAERAWVTGHGDNQALHEIRQLTAVGVACMEQCGAPMRGEPVSESSYPDAGERMLEANRQGGGGSVGDAIRKARGGDAPTGSQPQGFA